MLETQESHYSEIILLDASVLDELSNNFKYPENDEQSLNQLNQEDCTPGTQHIPESKSHFSTFKLKRNIPKLLTGS